MMSPEVVKNHVQMGMVDAEWAKSMQIQLPSEEYIRQFLCRNIQARNWIWEEHIRKALAVGLEAGLQRAGPVPGQRYKRRGLVSFGGHAIAAGPFGHIQAGVRALDKRRRRLVRACLGNPD